MPVEPLPYKDPRIEYNYVLSSNMFVAKAKAVAEVSTCYKQRTGAIIINCYGDVLATGNNSVKHPQDSCPREGYETGTRYDLCETACGGNLHAEVDAIKNLNGKEKKDLSLILYGHYWCCSDCCNNMVENGIKNVYLVAGSNKETEWF